MGDLNDVNSNSSDLGSSNLGSGGSRHIVRKWVKPEDLNQHGSLFGGRLLHWIDEEAAIICIMQLGTVDVVTRYMSEVNFLGRAARGDLLELDYTVVSFGRTSITLSCSVKNSVTGAGILTLERIVFVSVDENGTPIEHSQTNSTPTTERIKIDFPR